MSQTSAPPSGNALIKQLHELEAAKHDALQNLDADAYESSSAEQARLVSAAGPPAANEVSSDLVIALAKLARLNSALLLNLISISPLRDCTTRLYSRWGHRRINPHPGNPEGVGSGRPQLHYPFRAAYDGNGDVDARCRLEQHRE